MRSTTGLSLFLLFLHGAIDLVAKRGVSAANVTGQALLIWHNKAAMLHGLLGSISPALGHSCPAIADFDSRADMTKLLDEIKATGMILMAANPSLVGKGGRPMIKPPKGC